MSAEELADSAIIASAEYGSGNLQQDILILVLFLMGFIAVCVLLINLVRLFIGKKEQEQTVAEQNRMTGMGGKLAKLENDLNTFRTEVHRSLTFMKEKLADLETEVSAIAAPSTEIETARDATREERSIVEHAEEPEEVDAPRRSSQPRSDFFAPPPSADELVEGIAEPSERKSLFDGLKKTRTKLWSGLGELLGKGSVRITSNSLEKAEELLVEADLGVKTTHEILDRLFSEAKRGGDLSQEMLREAISSVLAEGMTTAPSVIEDVAKKEVSPFVVMVVGVNGAGKTTTTAKLGALFRKERLLPLLVAADTFRAGATSQLEEWGRRTGTEVYIGPKEAKPSTVVFDALEKAGKEDFDVVLVDTAGRLHTRQNLMQELEGIRNTLSKKVSGAPHKTLLVVDGTSGQNALQQAKEFNESTPIDGVIVTKLDGTAKGGIVVAIQKELGLPVCFIGVGEGVSDLQPFDADAFIASLLGGEDSSRDPQSAHAEQRKRRLDS